MRILATGLVLLAGLNLAAGDKTPLPPSVQIGPLTLAPSGFIESIGLVRSQTTEDNDSTRFGSIPLTPSPNQSVFWMGHSRIAVKGTWGRWSGYYESDFDQRSPAQPYRIRQFFGTLRLGGWEFSAGREFSLLRPNRRGINSEFDLMNTRVADPAYHVGLVGMRNQQVRAVRRMGDWRVAVSFEDGRDGLVKLAHDSRRLHWELMAMAGNGGHHGVSAAAVWRVHPNVDLVTQQFFAKGGGHDALGTAPRGIPAATTLYGLEANRGPWRAYSYAGLVYAGRSSSNRTVTQWTGGFGRELARHAVGRLTVNLQFSRIDRTLWSGPQGRQNLFMVSVRQFFGASR